MSKQPTPILLTVSSTFPAAYSLQAENAPACAGRGFPQEDSSQHQWLSISFASQQPFSNFPQGVAERQRHCGCLWPLKGYLSYQGREQLPYLEEPNERSFFVLEKGWLWADTAEVYRIWRGGGVGGHIFCARARGLQTQHVGDPKPKQRWFFTKHMGSWGPSLLQRLRVLKPTGACKVSM